MRFYMGRRVGKRGSVGVSMSSNEIGRVIWYLFTWPFYLIYYIYVWPFIALHKAIKKRKSAASAQSGAMSYSMPDDNLEEQPVLQLSTQYVINNPTSRKALLAARDDPYVVLDVETTGLSPQNDQIIELSMVRCEGGCLTAWSSLFDPGVPLPPQVVDLTGITDSDLQGAPRIGDKIDEILDFIGGYSLVAHNANFDARFLCYACSREGISGTFTFYDTLALARKAFPEMKNYKLNTLIRAFRLAPWPQTHRAADDATATQKLFKRCIDQLLEVKEADLAARRAQRAAENVVPMPRTLAPTPIKPESKPSAEPEPSVDDLLSDLSWLD